MKRYLLQIIALSVTLTMISCEDFLDREPLDQLTTDNFYKTAADADKALLATYSPMQDQEWNSKGWMITEIPSDNTQAGGTDPDFTPIDNFTVVADNLPVANYWSIRYRQITLANTVITKVNEMDLTQASKNPLLAEAMFLRAVAYFDLVRIYGGVPLITAPPVFGADLLYPRAKVAEVYALISADLEFAAEYLPITWGGINLGRATKGAANAYLAKAYLTNREYIKARDAAKKVIDSGVYDLMESYADNFELATSDNNKESIFQIQFTGCGPFGTGNALQAFFAPWGEGITKDRDGWGSQIPTSPSSNNPNTTIADAFETGDLRKLPSVMTPNAYYPTVNPQDGGYTYPTSGASASSVNIKKYVIGSGANVCFMSTPQNAHLIRYSDVLITYAESIMEIEGGLSSNPVALSSFNKVRIRAGLEPVNQIDRSIVLHERRVEFAFEGQRWFDLLRSGKAIEIMTLHGKNPNLHNLLFPIPAGELEVNNKLVQNPGY
ncbi:MAG: RagB/SusD family nutrient uptake outer membrane protein [Chitinophagales bacterium]